MELGKGEIKPTPGNPRGYSKRQITVLNFSRNKIRNINDDGNFSSWGGESESYKNNENGSYKKNMSFNMFQPQVNKEDITPRKEPETNEVLESTLMRDVKEDIKRIGKLEHDTQVTISTHAMHICSIVRDLNIPVERIAAWSPRQPNEINMLGWHKYQTELPRGFHEGSDEIMLALYKLNEVIFNAKVVYPFMVFNYESESYEYRKNSFMKFNPFEKNKNYKMFDETGFYKSRVSNISQYFLAFDQMLRQYSLSVIERDVWIFAMYYDFMSYVAQELRSLYRKGKSIIEGRLIIKEVINECSRQFILSQEELVISMCAIVNESYPEPMCVKDGKSDYQAQKTVIWTSQMGNVKDTKEKLVDEMVSNVMSPNHPFLRRGCNATQGLVSNNKRKRNRTPRTPLGLKMILEGTYDDENNTEGSDSDSPAFNPTTPSTMESVESSATSPPSTMQTTESSGTAQTQGPRMILEFTPVREQEPALDFESEERTDMSMFIAPVVMNSAQVAHSNWMVDSGAGMSGTSSTINLKDTMRCKIPITPAFGEVMNATSEGLINDPTFKQLGIKAIHIEGMHHNLLSVHQVCTGGESGEEQVGIFTSEGCQFFPLSKCKEALKIMSKCNNTFYGLVKGGVYVYAPAGSKK